MNLSWKLGRVAGIDVFLHPTFLLMLLAALASPAGLAGAVLLTAAFGCILLHEFGHALTARRFGIGTRDITLYPIGGVARLERIPRAPGAELLITLAGPAVNLAIAAALALVLAASGAGPGAEPTPVEEFAGLLMWVNLFNAGFNLLPAFPMDGGRIFRALLSGPLGRARATEIAAGLGQTLALGLPFFLYFAGLSGGWGLLLHLALAAFLYHAAGAERDAVRGEEAERQLRRDGWEPGLWVAPPGYRWISLGNGTWRLAPAVIPVDPDAGRARSGARPWL